MERPPVDPEIAHCYARGEEQERLRAGAWRLERVRTEELLLRHLPAAPAVVLDVGGGAGAYSLWLARRGYEVHLSDPIKLHVEQARAASARQPGMALASAEIGDARSLSRADSSVDAVLMLGPRYHLIDAAERRRALSEACRVLRPGGVVAAAGISRFASTLDGMFSGFLAVRPSRR